MMSSRPTAHPQNAPPRRVGTPWTVFLLSAAAVWLLACPGGEDGAENETPPNGAGHERAKIEARSTVPPERDIDSVSLRNMSELLAGLPPQSEDLWREIPPVWRRHMKASEDVWSRLSPRFAAMREWSETQRAELPEPGAPVLAPFGDPDLLAALSLFPAAQSYLLVGLESPGRLPLPEDFAANELEDDLRRLRAAFQSLADSGYFVRSRVQDGIRGGAFDGVLPILLVSLVRGGQVPVALDYVAFDPETREIQPLESEAEEARALRIFFRSESRGAGESREDEDLEDEALENKAPEDEAPLRAVYYFSQDLSNRGLLTDEPLAYLLRRQESLNVLLKAAEYRLHSSDYSLFRKLLLDEASALLQDDSGVPIRFLTSDRWNLHLYGRYHDVLAAYRAYHQDDLAAAFHKASPPALGFPIGFNSGPEGGGLLLALRKSPLSPPPAETAEDDVEAAVEERAESDLPKAAEEG